MLHLPSNRYAVSADEASAARVSELVSALSVPPRPDVVVGDMNSHRDSPPYRLMQECGYVDVAVALSPAGEQTGRKPNDGVLLRQATVDYIWIDKTQAGHVRAFSVLNAFPFCRQATDGTIWHLSDHPPLMADLA